MGKTRAHLPLSSRGGTPWGTWEWGLLVDSTKSRSHSISQLLGYGLLFYFVSPEHKMRQETGMNLGTGDILFLAEKFWLNITNINLFLHLSMGDMIFLLQHCGEEFACTVLEFLNAWQMLAGPESFWFSSIRPTLNHTSLTQASLSLPSLEVHIFSSLLTVRKGLLPPVIP